MIDSYVSKMTDQNGDFFVCSTKWYVPEWLRDSDNVALIQTMAPNYVKGAIMKKVQSNVPATNNQSCRKRKISNSSENFVTCDLISFLHSNAEHQKICMKDPKMSMATSTPILRQSDVSRWPQNNMRHAINNRYESSIMNTEDSLFSNYLTFGEVTNLAHQTTPDAPPLRLPHLLKNQPPQNIQPGLTHVRSVSSKNQRHGWQLQFQ